MSKTTAKTTTKTSPADRQPATKAGRPRGRGMDERMRERRHGVLAQRARRRRRVTCSVLVLLVVAGGGTALLRTSLFDISDVRVDGVQGEQAEQARSAAAV